MAKEITITVSDKNYELLQDCSSKKNQTVEEYISSLLFPFQEQQNSCKS